jgi:type VI secretion system protein ImpH
VPSSSPSSAVDALLGRTAEKSESPGQVSGEGAKPPRAKFRGHGLEAPDFFQLCRLLESSYPELPRTGMSQTPGEDVVRFAQEPSLTFAPVTVARLPSSIEARGGRVFVNFLGLLGPNGPMPLHVTDYARDRERNAGDSTIARFFDVFNHRAISLFYRAWAVNQMPASYDRPEEDRYAEYVGSFLGLGMPTLMDRDEVPDEAKLHMSGRLGSATKSAEGMEAVLRAYFDVPARVVEFVGRWLALPDRYWCRLGERSESAKLGAGVVAGRSVWDVQSCFRIRLGPMSMRDYVRLLPGGASYRRLLAWVRNYVGLEFDFEVQLVLKRAEVPRLHLGGDRSKGSMLGWTTWLTTGPLERDGDDLVTVAERTMGSAA